MMIDEVQPVARALHHRYGIQLQELVNFVRAFGKLLCSPLLLLVHLFVAGGGGMQTNMSRQMTYGLLCLYTVRQQHY